MGTLIKKRELLPSMVKKSFNKFFDEFVMKDLHDWKHKNSGVLDSKQQALNLNQTNPNIEETKLTTSGIKKEDFIVEIDNDMPIISSSEEEGIKKVNYYRKEFNYRSFCRLPN